MRKARTKPADGNGFAPYAIRWNHKKGTRSMAIEFITPKTDKLVAIEVLKRILISGQPCEKGFKVKVPANDASDLIHHGQARLLTAKEEKN